MPMDSPLVSRARELARVAHAAHVRKAGNVPYFTHLDGVASILAEHGYDDDTSLAAAYLHDLLEDRPSFAARMRDEMPPEVVSTVEALTEKKKSLAGNKLSKRERFEGYVEGLSQETDAVRRAIPISCADKIHNTRSLVRDEAEGHQLLMQLSTRPGEHEAQLATLRAIYAPHVSTSLLESFDAASEALLETVEAWLPGWAVMLAARAHLGQYDKAGAPYVLHPLRLMMKAQTLEEKLVAVLHDVVEDSRWSIEGLAREGFSPSVIRALDHLTKREGESYEDFIERVATDRLATRVKLLDLEDNADASRIPTPTEHDLERIARYRRALARLEDELEKRSIEIRLDDASREALAKRARLPVVRAAHVTIARRVRPGDLDPAWIPGGHAIGDVVSLRAVGECADVRVHAVVVELAGEKVRPFDGGVLHVTVSRASDARSRDANELFADAEPTPLDLPLSGRLVWVE